jgi:Zn-dependent peptidase ImmA (M78 family)
LRSLTPAWPVSHPEARWVAEQQATLLITQTGITQPPVPARIVTALDGVNVYPLPLPVKGLLGASRPSRHGGDILIDTTAPLPEQRVTLLHELKHIIDGGHTTRLRQTGSHRGGEGLCTDFAMSVLVPAPWLHADWQAGHRAVSALAERYQVPAETIEHQLHALGLLKQTRRHHRRAHCQWQTHVKNTKSGRTLIAKGKGTKGDHP